MLRKLKFNFNNLKYQVATGVILIIVGIALLLINFVNDKRDKVFSEMNLALSNAFDVNEEVEETEEVLEEDSIVGDNVNREENKSEVVYEYESYLGKIEIPKINFYKGFYAKESTLNNVKFNLYVMPSSSYPDVKNGNLIIAGHSGNYSNSYFKDLHLLVEGDQINIYYNNKKYIYEIKKIYLQDKTGTINVYRNLSKNTLTLITCTLNDEGHQTVYIAELI